MNGLLWSEAQWIYYSIYTIYALTVLGITVIIVSENRNPIKALSWIVLLLLLPLLGIVLYLFFGQSYKRKLMISKRSLLSLHEKIASAKEEEISREFSENNQRLIALAKSTSYSLLYRENKITTYTDGRSKFEALKTALRSAHTFIHLQYYIFADDTIGHEIAKILIERAEAGVMVRMLYDDVGCWSVKKSFFRNMRKAGIEIYPFQEVTFPSLANRLNYRNHRKVVIVDGEIGFVGGMNIADRYQEGVSWGEWRDTHIAIQGAAVQGLQKAFSVDWHFSGHGLLSDDIYYPHPKNVAGDVSMQIATGGPIGKWSGIFLPILKAISQAKSRIYITTPYFLPNESLLKALQTAALSQVDVRIIVPERSDSKLLHNATHSYLTEMMRAGVKIYLYHTGFVHAKTMVIDNDLVTVGSTNMDFRSFEHNFEINALIYNSQLNREFAELFHNDQSHATLLTPKQWKKRPFSKKVVESLVRLLSPLL